MSDLILYLTFAVVGYIVAARIRKFKELFSFTPQLQTVVLIGLVLAMGLKIGSNDEVVNNLNEIGFYALIFTIVTMTFTMFGLYLLRRYLKLDKQAHYVGDKIQGEFSKDADVQGEDLPEDIDRDDVCQNSADIKGQVVSQSSNLMTISIVVTVAIGIIGGYTFVPELFGSYENFDNSMSLFIKVLLCIMLFFVGFDMGLDGTIIDDFKKVGFKVALIPIVTIIFSLIGGVVCSILLPVGIKESLAIGAGLGWYSLAPGLMMEHGLVVESAISFMHNISREIFSILFIPFLAKKVGYFEIIGLSGAASGDVVLPVIVKSTRNELVIYAFVNGMVCSFAVTVLVPLIISFI